MKLEGREIALFCKLWSVDEPVWFANVCNVRGLPQLSRRAEAGGQNKIFSKQSSRFLFVYYSINFSLSFSFLALNILVFYPTLVQITTFFWKRIKNLG